MNSFLISSRRIAAIIGFGLITALPLAASAQVTAFRQAVAESAALDEDLANFYRARTFEGVWTGDNTGAQLRRNALLAAFADASAHGLPAAKYDPQILIQNLRAARTPAEMGRMEVRLTQLFLDYAEDVRTGILVPNRVIDEIKREPLSLPRLQVMEEFIAANPATYLRALPPRTPEYTRLMREKLRLETLMGEGGWGAAVNASLLQEGDSGPALIQLRNRLIAMGYLPRTATPIYDSNITEAVRAFQEAHGLKADGEAGETTLREINTSIPRRLQQVAVAMERERWITPDRGSRHIWVNLTDFTAAVVDEGRVTFSTRSVIGATDPDRRSPEFSDEMEFMVINPSWYVPRSIITKEYLPQLQRNPGAVRHLKITDRNGREVSRSNINFARYNERTFPFAMRQPPSPNNALGLVKFMFPNKYNIYLHDTPAKSLFGRQVRAFSHGCIRLNDPFDFAYHLLAAQTADPEDFFQSRLRSGSESRVNLDQPVPVHLVYRTAFTHVSGALQFRRDVYGRDARIWDALAREGVAINAFSG